ncbi:MAG: hypothetical protein KAR20_19630 [Candidatus Heimdallarchaeota archaeon]|nr:hypothetical protein [Candidatus Heimdallarchaeota archaeon]
MQALNQKTTEIFAYLQIYDNLTQSQLRELTQFASSTISTTLNSLLQSGIIIRDIIPKTHQYIYALKDKEVTFIYRPFIDIIDDLEVLDPYLIAIQNRLNVINSQLSTETQFMLRRINSIRNYIEVQRRTIANQSKTAFLNENVSAFLAKNELGKFPQKMIEIEKDLINYLVSNEFFASNDPMANRIFGYFYTRKNLTQKQLQSLTSISLSTISRILTRSLASEQISAYKKKYRKPRMYYLDSPAVSLISVILATDTLIFSWQQKFTNINKEMGEKMGHLSKSENYIHLKKKIEQIMLQIEAFQSDSNCLVENFVDMKKFFNSTF